jgi:hypothetical protein
MYDRHSIIVPPGDAEGTPTIPGVFTSTKSGPVKLTGNGLPGMCNLCAASRSDALDRGIWRLTDLSMARVEDDFPRWFQLLQEVEVVSVARKDRHSVFPRGGEDESVVQNSAPVGPSIALQTR